MAPRSLTIAVLATAFGCNGSGTSPASDAAEVDGATSLDASVVDSGGSALDAPLDSLGEDADGGPLDQGCTRFGSGYCVPADAACTQGAVSVLHYGCGPNWNCCWLEGVAD